MTTTQDLIAQLRALGIPDWAMARVLMTQAADTLEALQAELDEWRFTNKIDELQRVNEGLQAEVARLEAGLRLSQASGNAWKAGWESTLARLEAVEAQNLMARQIILEHGSGTIAATGASLVATPIVAWAKSTPRKLRITTMDMGREDGWRPLGYTAAGASPVEPSLARVVEPVAAANKDAVLQASIDFIRELTGMEPPPIEVAPPETFQPFKTFADKVCAIFATPQAAAQPPAPGEAAREYMTGYSDCKEWAKPSQALELELSDAEIKKISSDLTLYEDYQPESCQADYLDPVKFARAIIAAINTKKQS